MENNSRLCGMLGFAMRAGKVVIGAEQVISRLKDKAVRLVLLSVSASEKTKQRLTYKCEFYQKEIREINITTEELGRLLGKLYAPAVVAITDEGFANEIIKALSPGEQSM